MVPGASTGGGVEERRGVDVNTAAAPGRAGSARARKRLRTRAAQRARLSLPRRLRRSGEEDPVDVGAGILDLPEIAVEEDGGRDLAPESNWPEAPLGTAAPFGAPRFIFNQVIPSFDSAYPIAPPLGPPSWRFGASGHDTASGRGYRYPHHRGLIGAGEVDWPAVPRLSTAGVLESLPGLLVQVRPSVETASPARQVLVSSLAE